MAFLSEAIPDAVVTIWGPSETKSPNDRLSYVVLSFRVALAVPMNKFDEFARRMLHSITHFIRSRNEMRLRGPIPLR